jgi:hypothetical protein
MTQKPDISNRLGKDTKGSLIFGLMDTLPAEIGRREHNVVYSCPDCGRFFVVYRGRVECTCEAIRDKRYWNE